ncbi:MAG: hypothetical protein L0I76_30560 [Pseudonocardia sp.]|nr:hypothetical protein [Pseudonocardia sp.]
MSDTRTVKALRVSDNGIAKVQEVADRDGVTWSEAARRMLAYSYVSMPAGWPQRAVGRR